MAEDYSYRTENIDGIKTIINPEESFLGRIEMEMIEEVTIGVDEGEEPYMLVGPHRIYHFNHGKAYSLFRTEDAFLRVKRFRLEEKSKKGDGPI